MVLQENGRNVDFQQLDDSALLLMVLGKLGACPGLQSVPAGGQEVKVTCRGQD